MGHFAFVFVHPYMDGNGRMARFLMNAVLCTAGFPWTVIKLEQRKHYFAALNDASARDDIRPFARFIAECVAQSQIEYAERPKRPAEKSAKAPSARKRA